MLYSVLLVEDQDTTREWLASAIQSHPNLQLVAQAASCKQAREWLSGCNPDVLLTDIDLPDGSGIELILECDKRENCHSIVITVFGDEAHLVQAIRAGARGYLLKDSAAESIGGAIMDMLQGGSPISPAIARYLLRHFRAQSTANGYRGDLDSRKLPDLTRREQEVLKLIAKGYSYGEIADKLFLSIHTVNSHIKRLYRKLAVSSRGAAVYEATQLGLLTENE